MLNYYHKSNLVISSSYMSNGVNTVADVFIEYDVPKYTESEIFSELIQFLKEY